MNQVKIPDTQYVRDIHSKALLNTDKKALHEYLMKKEITKKQNEKTMEMYERVNSLENQLDEIKLLLINITERLNNAN